MKQLTFCLFTFIVFNLNLIAQPCTGNLQFMNQTDVNNFPTNHPGCSTWNGTIGLNMQLISNLDGLIGITKINGNLGFSGAYGFKNLNGLNNLTTITNSFTINNVDTLKAFNSLSKVGSITMLYVKDIKGLNNLDVITGQLSINEYQGTNMINVFNDMDSLGSLNISGGVQNVNVSGFNALNKINSINFSCGIKTIGVSMFNELDSVGYLNINANSSLTSLSGLDRNIFIQTLSVTANSMLSNCSVLALCKRAWATSTIIDGNLACPSISNLRTGCPQNPDTDYDLVPNYADNCISIYNSDQVDINLNGIGNLCDDVFDNDSDGVLNGVDNCDFVPNSSQGDADNDNIGDACESIVVCSTNWVIKNKSELNSFVNTCFQCETFNGNLNFNPTEVINPNGLLFLKRLHGNLIISGTGFVSYEGFKSLQRIYGTLKIANTHIQNTPVDSGFINLKYIGNDLYLNSPFYSNLNMFKNLDSIGGNMTLISNSYLGMNSLDFVGKNVSIVKDMRAIQNLAIINGNLQLNNLENSSIFTGSAIQKIRKDLIIKQCLKPNFNFLNQLNSIQGSLILENNSKLVSITGFQSLDSIYGTLKINENEILENISGFDSPIYLGSLSIKDNYFLNNCYVEAVCNKITLDGSSVIESNGVDCNSIQEVLSKCATFPDSDNDGVYDFIDNCAGISNADQKDCNLNNIGDVCEAFLDDDCDGISNSSDNCPSNYNPYQLDLNSNTIGDACENFNKIGINTTSPKAEFHLSNGNMYIDHPEMGLIFKATNGLCYRQVILFKDEKPLISLSQIACPN
jgi:hypothetical protein